MVWLWVLLAERSWKICSLGSSFCHPALLKWVMKCCFPRQMARSAKLPQLASSFILMAESAIAYDAAVRWPYN